MRRVIAAVLATAALTACSSGSEAKGPSASVTVTTLSAIEREVEAAYLKSWDVYAAALRNLDSSQLPASYAKDALRTVTSEVHGLKERNTPVRVSVEHRYLVELRADGSGLVTDKYMNHMVLLDPKTGEPTEPDPNHSVHFEFTLEQLEGAWKVTYIVQRS